MHGSTRPSGKVGWLQRLASAAALGYVHHFPIERGKYRLIRLLRSFLVVKLAPGIFIRVPDLDHIGYKIVREGMYEPETVRVFAALLSPRMTVLDVGANIGQYTLVAAGRVGPEGQVHAFEPSPHLAGRLKENLALNGITNVVVNEVAVSDAVGEAVLSCPDPDNPGENTIVSTGADGRPTASVPVKTTTIDTYLAERGVSRVDMVKIDIEGAELLALRGAAALLARDDAPLFVMELNPRTLSYGGAGSGDLLDLLKQHGYAFYPIATYYSDGPNPVTNGVVAKPAHWDRFPELGKLVSRTKAAAPGADRASRAGSPPVRTGADGEA